jgi:uncharacterized protein (DUF4415 family)
MPKKSVRFMVDLAKPGPLTEKEKADLKKLEMLSDDDIDYSDIPELTEEFWARARPNPLFKPRKTSTTLRIDSDVLAWFKAQGKGYQSRMNAVLRREMLASQRSPSH